MKKIIGIGNALVDVLARVPEEGILEELRLPKGSMQLVDAEGYRSIGRRLEAMPTKRATGGSAANTILALANLGMPAGFIGKIGPDEYGRFFADNCRDHGIRPYLLRDERPTGVASTFITPDGQRTFGTYLGAAACLQPADVRTEWFEGYDYFYIEGYLVQNHALIEHVVDVARAAGLKVCIDMASYNVVEAERDFFARLLTKTDVVFANEEEARAFTGAEPRQALGELAALCATAVVKTGADGALASRGGETVHVPAERVDGIVDTTAAGDFFAAGFLYAAAADRPLADCARLGTLLASRVIRVVGTVLPAPWWEELRAAADPVGGTSYPGK